MSLLKVHVYIQRGQSSSLNLFHQTTMLLFFLVFLYYLRIIFLETYTSKLLKLQLSDLLLNYKRIYYYDYQFNVEDQSIEDY